MNYYGAILFTAFVYHRGIRKEGVWVFGGFANINQNQALIDTATAKAMLVQDEVFAPMITFLLELLLLSL